LDLEELSCPCSFNRKYLLPCKHFFYLDIFGDENVLTNEVWEKYLHTFEEAGYEVYDALEKITVDNPCYNTSSLIDTSQKLTVFSTLEQIKDIYFTFEDIKNSEQKEISMSSLIETLKKCVLEVRGLNKDVVAI
jgi:hypothetical protein